MITKEQFLNGVEFTIDGTGTFKYTCPSVGGGTIERTYRNKKGIPLFADYECNVDKVTNNSVTIYTTVMGENIRKRIKFQVMVEYTQPEQLQY